MPIYLKLLSNIPQKDCPAPKQKEVERKEVCLPKSFKDMEVRSIIRCWWCVCFAFRSTLWQFYGKEQVVLFHSSPVWKPSPQVKPKVNWCFRVSLIVIYVMSCKNNGEKHTETEMSEIALRLCLISGQTSFKKEILMNFVLGRGWTE